MLPAEKWSATHVRFVAAWAIGFPTLFIIDVYDGFGALLLASGLLLIWAGVELGRDADEWDSFRRAVNRGRRDAGLPGHAYVRWGLAAALTIIGAGWLFGGVLGALALVGLYVYP